MRNKLVITQARTASTRLPKKILLKILEKEILLHFLDRVLAAERVDHIIVATTDQPADQVIADLVQSYHPRVSLFRGSEEDVLDRYYQAARQFCENKTEAWDIIRITSDCPLIDPVLIDRHISAFENNQVDYLSSRIHKRTWPHGMELEIFSFRALQIAWQQAVDKYEREHVTPYIYHSHAKDFTLSEFTAEKNWSGIRLTLDYWEDYLLIKAIYEKLYRQNPGFGWTDILRLLKQDEQLLRINAKWNNPQVIQK
jgi:spore coat polysaccharide biosynthesis protein SpsF